MHHPLIKIVDDPDALPGTIRVSGTIDPTETVAAFARDVIEGAYTDALIALGWTPPQYIDGTPTPASVTREQVARRLSTCVTFEPDVCDGCARRLIEAGRLLAVFNVTRKEHTR